MEERVDKYFRMLHPEYETLTPEERSKLIGDRVFIRDHVDEIESWYEEAVGHVEGAEEPRIIEEAIRKAKSEMYKKMLYPDHSNLDSADRDTVIENVLFIDDHVDEIESWYEEAVGHGAEEGDPRIIEEAIRVAKSKTKKFTPTQIGKATINVPTEAKKDAGKVETGENTLDEKKEGEEVGDGN